MADDAIDVRGIFCIETVWFGTTDRTSMRPMLQWLHDAYGTPFLYRDAISHEEFFRYLDAWREMKCGANGGDKQYPILILAYHGGTDGIWVTDEEVDTDDEEDSCFVRLQEIGEYLEGACENKVVHFASCSTINVSNSAIGEFLETTHASAVSGYAKDIDWTWSMAFDLLYLQGMQEAKYKFLSPTRMKEVSDYLKDENWASWEDDVYPYDAVRKRLGFDIRERSKPA